MLRIALAAAVLALSAPALAQDEPEVWVRLPEPVTNNAVAGVELDGRPMAYSFAGLHAGKTWRDVTADAYACDLGARECREIDGLPDGIGRLASVAVTVRDQIYVFGGYTVAEDHSERSTPEVWRFDPATETYTHITDMPVPVDDSVALTFQDRYVYLVSGWHDTDNVDLVQVYDVEEDRWFEATPFPGAPVFGHAGAVFRNGRLMICGGTAVIPPEREGARRSFAATDACWAGRIDEDALDRIAWEPYDAFPTGPLYRAAATNRQGHAIFLGGTDNAYNYNGIGYNNQPSEPTGLARLETCCVAAWTDEAAAENFWRMDIRGVVDTRDALFLLGGMKTGQTVTDEVLRIPAGLVQAVLTIQERRAGTTDDDNGAGGENANSEDDEG